MTILGGILYADKKGFTPVIDMKSSLNSYLFPDEVGRVNSWEYYFEQPGGITLEDALSGRKYIIGMDAGLYGWGMMSVLTNTKQNKELVFWRKLCRKYIRFTKPVLERLNAMTQKYSGKKILGVLVRGTDYVALKPYGHAIPPTAEQAIAKAREVMTEKNFDAVYLATEDKRIVAKFQEAFGEKLLLPEADYLDYNYDAPQRIARVSSSRKNDKYLRGLEYLVSMLFLGKCAGLITCKCGGAAGALLFSDSFEYFYVFDLGEYQ